MGERRPAWDGNLAGLGAGQGPRTEGGEVETTFVVGVGQVGRRQTCEGTWRGRGWSRETSVGSRGVELET